MRARQESMSTREANGLVGAVVRGEEAEGASQRAPPHLFDLGFGIADLKEEYLLIVFRRGDRFGMECAALESDSAKNAKNTIVLFNMLPGLLKF